MEAERTDSSGALAGWVAFFSIVILVAGGLWFVLGGSLFENQRNGVQAQSSGELDEWSIAGRYLKDDRSGSFIRLVPVNYQDYDRQSGNMKMSVRFEVDSDVVTSTSQLVGPMTVTRKTQNSWTLYHQSTGVTLMVDGRRLSFMDAVGNLAKYDK